MKIFSGPIKKKGDLSLSVNTIVIIVLAITLLGLGLTFIRVLVGDSIDKIGGFIDAVDLDEQPTSNDPLIIAEQIEIKRDSDKNVNVGFYNRDSGTVSDIKPTIVSCIDLSDVDVVDEKLPVLAAPVKDALAPSKSQGFLAVITDQGLGVGRYICTLSMLGDFGDDVAPSVDFYLKIIP